MSSATANPARERALALGLMATIFAIGGGFLAYSFVYAPIRDKNAALLSMQEEIDKSQSRIDDVLALIPKYEAQRRLSLPADIDLSRREYEMQINGLLRRSEFPPNSITIVPRPPDNRSAPVVVGKKTAYTKLTFLVQVRGELLSLVDFLEHFYEQPLLHQIKNVSVQRPGGVAGRERDGRRELDISMTLEALVLDNADNRHTLIPVPVSIGIVTGGAVSYRIGAGAVESGKGSPFQLNRTLATMPRNYQAIAGKNIFFGPPTPPPVVAPEETPKEPDLSPYIRLTSITRSSQTLTASLFDFYNNYEYLIEQGSDGSTQVEIWYYLADRKRRLSRNRELQIGDAEGGNLQRYRIVLISESDLIIAPVDELREFRLRYGASLAIGSSVVPALPPRGLRWHVGELLKEAETLTTRQTRDWALRSDPLPGSADPGR